MLVSRIIVIPRTRTVVCSLLLIVNTNGKILAETEIKVHVFWRRMAIQIKRDNVRPFTVCLFSYVIYVKVTTTNRQLGVFQFNKIIWNAYDMGVHCLVGMHAYLEKGDGHDFCKNWFFFVFNVYNSSVRHF